MKVSVLEGFARHGIRLVVLFVFLVGMTGDSHAQAAGVAGQPGAKAAAPRATTAKTAQAGQPAATVERRPGGNHEGITVHGHWTIEVRNPDGKLVSHTEFENALAPSGGAALLAGLLAGTVTPGSWEVYLADDSSGDNPLVIAEANSAAAAVCSKSLGGSIYQACYDTLSVTGSQLGSGGAGILALSGDTVTFTGSASVPTSNYGGTAIAWVETAQAVCQPSNSPSACFDVNIANTPALTQPLTARNLDGVGSDPPAVQVSPGQAILVSVVISFGSGS